MNNNREDLLLVYGRYCWISTAGRQSEPIFKIHNLDLLYKKINRCFKSSLNKKVVPYSFEVCINFRF